MYALQYTDDEDLGALTVPGRIVALGDLGQDGSDGIEPGIIMDPTVTDLPLIPMEPVYFPGAGLTPPEGVQPFPGMLQPTIPMEPTYTYSPAAPLTPPTPGSLNIPASPMPDSTNHPGGPITSMITAAGGATAAIVSVYPRQANSLPLPPGAIGYNVHGQPINASGQVLNSSGLPSFLTSSTFGIPNVLLIGGALIFAIALGGKR